MFINAAHAEYTRLLQKNLGKKRFEVSEDGAKDILHIYEDYAPCSRDIVYEKTGKAEHIEVAKVIDYDDFRYTTVATRRPLRLWFEHITEKYEDLCVNDDFDPELPKNEILKRVSYLEDVDDRRTDREFFQLLKDNNVKYTAAQVTLLRNVFGTIDEDAPVVTKNPLKTNSEVVPDSNLNDTEKVPEKQDIDEYFQHEVLPYAPDAWMDRSKDKQGVEFPFTRLFYIYRPLRSTEEILAELAALDKDMENELEVIKAEE